MSTTAPALLEDFKQLPSPDQLAVFAAISRTVGAEDYGPLSDEELTAIAAESFALLDEEEARAASR